MSTLILIGKKVMETRLMQDADLFESFKFIGCITKLEECKITLPLPKVLKNMRAKTPADSEFEVVGLIEPQKRAVVLEGHKVYSTGHSWGLVEDLCASYGVKEPRIIKE